MILMELPTEKQDHGDEPQRDDPKALPVIKDPICALHNKPLYTVSSVLRHQKLTILHDSLLSNPCH
jgi:hypothetical protein